MKLYELLSAIRDDQSVYIVYYELIGTIHDNHPLGNGYIENPVILTYCGKVKDVGGKLPDNVITGDVQKISQQGNIFKIIVE